MKLSKETFDQLRDYIHDICGVTIPDDRQDLVEKRLAPLVISSGSDNFVDFYKKLSESPSGHAKKEVIDAITISDTSFFRDTSTFDSFKKIILPELGKLVRGRKARSPHRKGSKVRVWSAGCSTGQEAYSLAMLFHEYTETFAFHGISWEDFEIVATDISTTLLTQAIEGEYNSSAISDGLSDFYRDRYFVEESKDLWRIHDDLRAMVDIRQINLTHPFQMLGGFDVIFCRNVLPYFDEKALVAIFKQFHDMLTENGYLIIGENEHPYGIDKHFDDTRVGTAHVYRIHH